MPGRTAAAPRLASRPPSGGATNLIHRRGRLGLCHPYGVFCLFTLALPCVDIAPRDWITAFPPCDYFCLSFCFFLFCLENYDDSCWTPNIEAARERYIWPSSGVSTPRLLFEQASRTGGAPFGRTMDRAYYIGRCWAKKGAVRNGAGKGTEGYRVLGDGGWSIKREKGRRRREKGEEERE